VDGSGSWGQQWDRKEAEQRKLSGKPPVGEAPANAEAETWKDFALEALSYVSSEMVADKDPDRAAEDVAQYVKGVADKLTAEYYGRRAKRPA
jgi:hypothetical protein